MSQRAIYIGIDLGTTVLKAAAFDGASGRLVAEAAHRLPIDVREGGIREQDPAAVDRAVVSVFGKLRRALGADWRAVAGLGLAAQGGSAAIVERDTGRALTPLMLWNDIRGYRELPALQARKPERFWLDLADRCEPGAGLGRMTFLRRDRPELFDAAHLYAGAGESLFFQLTQQWRQDAGNALQIGCYSIRKWDRVPEPLELVGVGLDFVAPMRRGHETHPLCAAAARRLGLPEGLPVAGPYMDHEAGYLAALGPLHKPLQVSLGTAWVGNFVLPLDAPGRSPYQLVIPAPVGEGRQVVQPLLTGNVTWDWALARFVHANHGKALERAAAVFEQSLLPAPGVAALPWLNRPNPWDENRFGGASILGLNPDSDAREMLRAVAAGMCYEFARVHREVVEGGAVDGVVLGGGASRGAWFRTLLAALFAPFPVFVQAEDLAGPRGALYGLSRRAARIRTVRVPAPPKALRERIRDDYAFYLELFHRLYGHVPAGGAFTFAAPRKGSRR